MKVDVTTVGSFQKQLAFVVPPDQVQTQLEAAYKRLAGRVRMPGFRPGKAPRRVLEGRYGPQIEADVANDLIQQSYRTALASNNIQPVGQPNLADSSPVIDQSGFKFTITVDVRPEIDLATWTGVDVVYPEVSVEPADVDRSVKARLEGRARLEEATGRPVAKGDMALIELVARAGDEELAREPGTMIRTDGDPYYPGVESLVIGAEAGVEASGTVTFGADARTPAVAGREAEVTFKVLAIQSYKVPELDDALATELGYEGGAAGMRTAIEAQIRQARDEMARNQARANLLEVIIAKNPFEVPASMVEQSLKMLMDELKLQQSLRSGRDPRTIGFNEAQVQDLRMRSHFAAKAALILEWVAKKEGISVTDDDIEAKYKQLATERNQTVEAVKGWFQKENASAELRERILEEKTLDWLLERANLVAPSAAAPAGPLSSDPLEGSVDALKERLASGAFDAQLDALTEAETAGRNRKGALTAIDARKKETRG
ncbi:MAG: trigger factor [Myxococcota bacterium]